MKANVIYHQRTNFSGFEFLLLPSRVHAHLAMTTNTATYSPGNQRSRNLPKLLLCVLMIPILFAHVFLLADIPAGLFLDESSIGYNAVSILDSGKDEHGIRFPVYFESVGDYKNPVFVYAAAVMLKVFSVSEYSLRLTSVIFYFSALAITLLLINRMFQGNRSTLLYALASFGFLPLFFTISRVAFEVIAQLTWVSAGMLFVWLTFHAEDDRYEMLKGLACGLILGTSTYTYSTGRLLAFFSLAALWAVYSRKDNYKKLSMITFAFMISLVPFILFTVRNPGAITSRFYLLSFMGEPISLTEKIHIFVQNYFTYLSPRFLILQGDPNLRHSTGHGGIIYIATLLFFIIGLAGIVINKRVNRFDIFLFVCLLISPAAAALTSEGTPHALRSMLLGYYIFLFSCYGMEIVSSINNSRVNLLVQTGIFLLLLYEISGYQLDYFLAYPSRSVKVMGSYDFRSALQFAIDQIPVEIVFMSKPHETYPNMQFYSLLVDNPGNIPITWDNRPKPTEDICILFHAENERELDQYPFPFIEYNSAGVTKTRCYLHDQ